MAESLKKYTLVVIGVRELDFQVHSIMLPADTECKYIDKSEVVRYINSVRINSITENDLAGVDFPKIGFIECIDNTFLLKNGNKYILSIAPKEDFDTLTRQITRGLELATNYSKEDERYYGIVFAELVSQESKFDDILTALYVEKPYDEEECSVQAIELPGKVVNSYIESTEFLYDGADTLIPKVKIALATIRKNTPINAFKNRKFFIGERIYVRFFKADDDGVEAILNLISRNRLNYGERMNKLETLKDFFLTLTNEISDSREDERNDNNE